MRSYTKLRELGRVFGVITRAEAAWLIEHKHAEWNEYTYDDPKTGATSLALRGAMGNKVFVWSCPVGEHGTDPVKHKQLRGSLPDPTSERSRQPWLALGMSEATYYRAKASGVLVRMAAHGVPQTRENIRKWGVCERKGFDIMAVFGAPSTPYPLTMESSSSSSSSDDDDNAPLPQSKFVPPVLWTCGLCGGDLNGQAHRPHLTWNQGAPDVGLVGVEVV